MKKKSIFIALGIMGTLLISWYVYQLYNINKPKIYGLTINLNSSGGHQIVDIDFDTGLESNPRSLGIGTSVYGIARKYSQSSGQNEGIVTAIETYQSACGSGTAFYNVNLTTGQSVKLGIAQGYEFIKNIEYNPIDNKLYGIYNDVLIRVENLGTCPAGTNGTPALITKLGKLGNIGSGPYSVYFDHLGTCYVISGKEHIRGVVQIPAIPNGNANLITTNLVDASWNIPTPMDNINIASCMSGTTQIIGLSYSSATINTTAFYHLASPSWKNKGTPWQIIDYTSTAMTSDFFKKK